MAAVSSAGSDLSEDTTQSNPFSDQTDLSSAYATDERPTIDELPFRTAKPSFLSLFRFMRRTDVIPLLAFVATCMVTAVYPSANAVLIGSIVNCFNDYLVTTDPSYNLLAQVQPYLISMALIGIGCIFLWTVIMFTCQCFTDSQIEHARNMLLDSLMEKDMAWYDALDSSGALMTKCEKFFDEYDSGMGYNFSVYIFHVIDMLFALGVGLYFSWRLMLVILCAIPAIAIVHGVLSKEITNLTAQENTISAHTAKIVNWAVAAIQTVQLFNAQSIEATKFTSDSTLSSAVNKKIAFFNALQQALTKFIVLLLIMGAFWYGGTLVRTGHISAGSVLTVYWTANVVMHSVSNFGPKVMAIEKAQVAMESVRAIIDSGKRANEEHKQHKSSSNLFEGQIRFSHVNFAYPSRSSEQVLKDVSFSIPPRQLTFIIGESGSGKSSLHSLLLSLYRPSSGEITISGIDVEFIDNALLRQKITVVQQDSVLFCDTIAQNIRLGSRSPGPVKNSQMTHAITMAMMTEMLNKLPDGIDTVVKDGTLSGGQRQRVALARAIIRNSPILILDEATSALDPASQSLIIDAIRAWRADRTTIIVTHNLSQVGQDDRVIVMQSGKVAQCGLRYELEADPAGPLRNLSQAAHENIRNQREPWHEMDSHYSDDDLDEIFHPPHYSVMPHSQSRISAGDVLRSIETKPSTFSNQLKPDDIEIQDIEFETITIADEDLEPKVQQQKESSISIIRFLFLCMQTQSRKFLMALGIIFALINGAAMPLFSYSFARLLYSIFPSDDGTYETSYKWPFIVLGISVVDSLSAFGNLLALDVAGEVWTARIKNIAFRKVLTRNWSWFLEVAPVARLEESAGAKRTSLSRVLVNVADDMRTILSRILAPVISAVVMLSVAVIWAMVVGWELTLVGLAMIPIVAGCGQLSSLNASFWTKLYAKQNAAFGALAYEVATKLRTVQVLSLEHHFTKTLRALSASSRRLGYRRGICAGIVTGLNDCVENMIQVILLYTGSSFLTRDSYTLTQVLTVFTLLVFSSGTTSNILRTLPQTSKAKEGGLALLQLAMMREDESVIAGVNGRRSKDQMMQKSSSFASHGPKIEFHRVVCSYPGRRATVLSDLTMTIYAGESIAIVGESGCGKSTVANLLTRLLVPESGEITFDGHNIQSIDVELLRRHISVVMQSTKLFDGSIYQNITYGLGIQEVDMRDVEDVCRQVGIHEFIVSLPESYDMHLGDSVLLSGGQIQRMAIARALLRKPRLFIFDEMTSALDAASARQIRQVVVALSRDGIEIGGQRYKPTVIMITHSPEIMKCSDRIVVMRAGSVVEVGEFYELASNKTSSLAALLKQSSEE
ncbi:P-loop containing nucleoside triphosphate hydrolase protein [Limtongia smithiae]|uniref:P-loop containing nucleoside triphosphate hydrolase protein n=1 Tax=Limtongia smithiae TaxID=1125753 RepID=UPI0034CEF22B